MIKLYFIYNVDSPFLSMANTKKRSATANISETLFFTLCPSTSFESFPFVNTKTKEHLAVLFDHSFSIVSVCSVRGSGINCGQKTTSQSLNFLNTGGCFFLSISKIDPQ